MNENKMQEYDYIIELMTQRKNLLENIQKAVYSTKIILKEDNISSNHRDFVLEKYYFFITQSLYAFFILKSKNLNKEEITLISNTFQYILKNTLNTFLTFSFTLKYYIDFLKILQNICQNNNNNDNQLNIETMKNWKIVLNDNNYIQNKYKSDNKYNFVINYIIKYFSLCFNRQGNNDQISNQLKKDLTKCIIDDKYKIFKNLIIKLNDFRITFDLKIQMIYLIKLFYDWEKKENLNPIFNNIYFFLKQITSFYHMLFYLCNDYFGTHIREEKIQQKENFQKNMIRINVEENDYNSNKRNNLNHLFLII